MFGNCLFFIKKNKPSNVVKGVKIIWDINPIGVSPIKGSYKISSKYGKRIDPVLRNKHAMHGGLDLVGDHKKNQIISVLDGVIVFSGKKHGYGYSIDILHKSGNESVITRYCHLSKINVEKGDIVKKNQVIGLQGSTGRATGEHLHYEIRYLNKTFNPIHFINFNDKNKV